ncbi:MAG: S8 family peptidase [Terriglobia bacterium]
MYTRVLQLSLLFLAASILATAHAAAQTAAPGPKFPVEYVNGHTVAASQIIAKFKTVLTADETSTLQVQGDVDRVQPVGGTGAILIHSRSASVQELLDLVSDFPGLVYANPDYVEHAITVPNDPGFGSQWGLHNTGQVIENQAGTPGDDIKATAAWGVTTGSSSYILGGVDTGIDYGHPDLAANVWSAPSAFTVTIGGNNINCPQGSHGFNAITLTCDSSDDNGHGTATAGVMGAVGNNSIGVSGVNWTTRIIGLKGLDSTGYGTDSELINAIDFAIQVNNKFGGVIALNNSYGGGGYDQAFHDEIGKTYASGILFVAAAGNNSSDNDSTPFYPASYKFQNVIAVAATDNKDQLASFSNYGANGVQLGAPGVGIYTLANNNSYQSLDGTSLSTPFVTGTAALVSSVCGLPGTAIGTDIDSTVDADSNLSGKTVTGGRLDSYQALHACTKGSGSGTGSIEVDYSVPPGCYPVDSDNIVVSIDGIAMAFDYYSGTDDAITIAQNLANQLPAAYISASASGDSGSATVTMNALAKGVATNFSVAIQVNDNPGCTCGGGCPFFNIYGSNFTGGAN